MLELHLPEETGSQSRTLAPWLTVKAQLFNILEFASEEKMCTKLCETQPPFYSDSLMHNIMGSLLVEMRCI